MREALAGKHILLIGVTGFIGKVWLANLLGDLLAIGKIHLLIRPQRFRTARQRFEKIVEESPVFDGLHQRTGSEFARFVSERIEVVEGDVTQPGLGIEPEARSRLQRALDLVVNSSGLTEFNPDLRPVLATNIDAPVNILDFVRQSDHAGLLHLSTCYVAGARDGRVSEELRPITPRRTSPTSTPSRNGGRCTSRSKTPRPAPKPPKSPRSCAGRRGRRAPPPKIFRHGAGEPSPQEPHPLATQLSDRSRHPPRQPVGWPNTYTFTKSLAESLLLKLGADLPVAVVRPSIVETSVRQPFCGWNEGINTSAPLSYLLGTYFRQLPTNERKCLDLIPVDVVCRGMTLIAAAVVARCHQRLYQLATSANNPCDMRRSIELTSLAHRKHYRAQEGLEHWLRSRFDSIPVSKERYQALSAPRQRAIVRALKHLIWPFRFLRSRLTRRERDLDKVEKLIQLYEPFILHNQHVFEAENVELLSHALPPEEKTPSVTTPIPWTWWDYWINVHVPALRKWCYPLIEGRRPESGRRRAFQLLEPAGSSAVERPAGRSGNQTLTPEATWPSS